MFFGGRESKRVKEEYDNEEEDKREVKLEKLLIRISIWLGGISWFDLYIFYSPLVVLFMPNNQMFLWENERKKHQLGREKSILYAVNLRLW